MKHTNIIDKINLWHSVYQRIRFFRKMYPLSAIFADFFLFPIDYFFSNRLIKTVRNVTVAITHRCNIFCQMCYFQGKIGDSRDLSFLTYKRIIDSLKRSHPSIILSGGEPFLHPYLIDMVGYAKDAGLAVQIFTNGTLVNPNSADALVNKGLDYINFTLLGNESSHALVTNVPDSYRKFINNLAYFAYHRGDTKVILNFTITPQALTDIGHAIKIARQYNLDGLRIQHYNFLIPQEFKKQKQIMTTVFGMDSVTNEIEVIQEISGLVKQLLSLKKKLSKELSTIPVQWAPSLTDAETEDWYSTKEFKTKRRCLFPWRGILVDADSKIYPCSKIYLQCGDLEKEEVFEAWNSMEMKKFRGYLKGKIFPACSRCCKL